MSFPVSLIRWNKLLVVAVAGVSLVAGVDDEDRVSSDQRGLNPPRRIRQSGSAGGVDKAGDVARKTKATGTVILEFEVTREGTTENIKVVRGLEDSVDRAIIEEVRKQRYEPATKLNGLPVRYKVKAEWQFGPWRN